MGFVKPNTAGFIMDELTKNNVQKEIRQLKEALFRQKEQLGSISQLVKTEIDRDFHIDLWELSPRELDSQMGERLTFLNSDIDPRPDVSNITSHRRFTGWFIVRFKKLVMRLVRMYTDHMAENIIRFNEQSVAFHLASFIRFRRNDEKFNVLREQLKAMQEDREILLERLEQVERLKDK